MVRRPVSQYPYVLQGSDVVLTLQLTIFEFTALVCIGLREGMSSGVRITAVEMCNVATALAFGVQTALEMTQVCALVMRSPWIHPLAVSRR